MLEQLKQGTAALHQEVEQENLARFIMDSSISQDQYDMLLRQNFMVYKGVEDFINARYDMLPESLKTYAGYEKTNRLAKDISSISSIPLPKALSVIGPRNLPTLIGKLYVVEGSMLGGMMMAKKLKSCSKIDHITEHHFFNEDTSAGATRWKNFKNAVSELSFEEDEIAQAVTSAQETFLLYKKAYLVKAV